MILFRKPLMPEVFKINYSCFDHPRWRFFSKSLSGIELKFAPKECLMKRVRRLLLSFLSRHYWVSRFFDFVKSHCVLSPQFQGPINVGKIRLVSSERFYQVSGRAILVPEIGVTGGIGVDRFRLGNERRLLNLIELAHQLILVKELRERPHLFIDLHILIFVKFLINFVVFWKNTRHLIFLFLLEPSHDLIQRFPLGQFGLLGIWDKVIEMVGLGVLVLGGMRKRKVVLECFGCLVGESLKLNVEL